MKPIVLSLVFLFSISAGLAQKKSDSSQGGRLQAYKIAFLTKKLELTPQEAQQFWPVYNQYETEMRNARRENVKEQKSEIEREEELLAIRKKYTTAFGKVIAADKVNLLYKSEKEFNAIVQKELMERRGRGRD